MNLRNKKELAARTLGVGKNKIIFHPEGLPEIKEAITKQDILTLYQEGIIGIKETRGRRKIVKRKTRRGPGKIKKKINKRKENYVKLTRKLRKYIKDLSNRDAVEKSTYIDVRKKIKMSTFKSKAHLKEYIDGLSAAIITKKADEKKSKSSKENKTKKTKEKTE